MFIWKVLHVGFLVAIIDQHNLLKFCTFIDSLTSSTSSWVHWF